MDHPSKDLRDLHIGLLNMMPDAALKATEQQFARLVGSCTELARFHLHVFSIDGLPRSAEGKAYIDEHYETFASVREDGLDALIVTGANVSNPSLDQEPFWAPLQEVIAWATTSTCSVLCSCLATHALMKYRHHAERQKLPAKRWGVYSHRVHNPHHPLTRDINTRFDVPHSRHNDISREQFLEAGLTILVDSDEGGVHMAVSPDQFRTVYFQAHPEYDANSLLKEYKREVHRFIDGARQHYPPHPEHYFSEEAAAIADAYHQDVLAAKAKDLTPPPFPENDLERLVDNTWGDTGKAIFNNWLGLVFRLADVDRKKTFAPHINPDDPLGLLGRS